MNEGYLLGGVNHGKFVRFAGNFYREYIASELPWEVPIIGDELISLEMSTISYEEYRWDWYVLSGVTLTFWRHTSLVTEVDVLTSLLRLCRNEN